MTIYQIQVQRGTTASGMPLYYPFTNDFYASPEAAFKELRKKADDDRDLILVTDTDKLTWGWKSSASHLATEGVLKAIPVIE